jgi:hypothetical protein
VLDLNSKRWKELQHAYGSAADIPALLKQLASVPAGQGEDEPWFSLWSALAHQGDVFSASFAAVPHVVQALATAPARADSDYFHFPAWVEICRYKKGVAVPEDLQGAYREALSRLPGLVAAAAERSWDDTLMCAALAAIAASKGQPTVAEAILELSPEVAVEFMDWFWKR